MREFIKVACALLIVGGMCVSLFVWLFQRPNEVPFKLRIVAPLVCLMGCIGFGVIHFQKEGAPDFLRTLTKGHLNRNGLCFAFWIESEDGVPYLVTPYQSQFEGPSIATIALRPSRGFWGRRGEMPSISFELNCPPAGFGVVRVPISIPASLRGRAQEFEVGATVQYRNGRGRQVRFRDGTVIRMTADFSDRVASGFRIAALLAGTVLFSSPATVTLKLPHDVRDDIPITELPARTYLRSELGDSSNLVEA